MDKKKARTPRQARTFNQICDLPRDNISFKNFWVLIEGDSVTIKEQTVGETPKSGVTIPRSVFNKMVDWYNTGSKISVK